VKRWRQLWPLLTVLAWPGRWPALAYLASSQHEIAAVKGTGDGEPCLSVSLAVIYGVVGVRRVTAQESSVRLSPLAGRMAGAMLAVACFVSICPGSSMDRSRGL